MDATEVAERFGLGARARWSGRPADRGKVGEVRRLETADGAWAVKTTYETGDIDELRATTEHQEAAHAAGVPVPPVRRAADGDVAADVGGVLVRVQGWVEVGGCDPMLDPEQVGAVLAAMHQVPHAITGDVDPWWTDGLGAQGWDELLARLRAAGAPFADRLADLRDELVALEAWLVEPADLRTCHRDLWADNLRPARDGGVCVLDWDNAGPADPSHELACAVFEFARTDPGRVRALVGSYGGGGGPGRITDRGQFSMLIAQLNHITALAASDWLTPNARTPTRADAEAWVGETLDDPHSREVLDRLLSWTVD